MTRDEIINLAISAGFNFFDAGRASMLHTTKAHYPEEYFALFAALIAAAERAKLYALPGAQPAPSVPDAWKLVPIEPTEAMVTAFAELFNVRDQKNTFGPAFRAALAAAPEAKP